MRLDESLEYVSFSLEIDTAWIVFDDLARLYKLFDTLV